MDKKIDRKSNVLIYPIQQFMGKVVHLFLMFISIFVPISYQNRISELEKSPTFNNIVGLTIFNAIGGLVVMLTNVKIANVLGASLYGLFSYYLAIGEVGQNFVRYGRSKTMTRDLIQLPLKYDSLIANTFIIGLLNIIIYLIVVISLSSYLSLDITIPTILLLLAPCIGSIDFQPVYEALKEMSWHSIYLLIQKVLFLLTIWSYLFFRGVPSVNYLGVVLFLSWIIIVVLQFKEIIIGQKISIFKNVSLMSIRMLYKDNFIIALSCMTAVAFGPLIRLILRNYSDTQSVGVYSAGMQIFLISQFFLHQISRVGNPLMAEAGKPECSKEERKKFCNKYFLMMLIGTIPFAIPLILFPNQITTLFFSQEYEDLGIYLPLFGVYLLSLSLGVVYAQFLISMRKDKTYFIIFVGTALITAIVALIIIPPFRVWGAVIALCIPHSIGCLLYYFCSIKYIR